jgi:adhesin transport system outer membrane protein
MKTRNILMFTVSVTSLSSISTADSDNMLVTEQSTPAISTTVAAVAVTPSVEAAVAKVATSSVAVVEVAAAPDIDASPAIAAAIPAEALMSETTIDFVDMAPAAMPAQLPASLAVETVEAAVTPLADEVAAAVVPAAVLTATIAETVAPAQQAVAAPLVQTETAAPAMAIAPVAILSAASVVEAVPAGSSMVATDAPATAKVTVPEAPQYTFFDGSTAAAPAAAMQSSAMDYTGTVTLDQAIAAALETSPEINQAIMNKEAIEFEREQAQGLYLPRVDIEASAGIRRLENPTRRTLGIEDDALYPLEAGITAEQTIIDFGRRHGELMRQAARTDGAALRVAERSENTALLVSRQYLDILLQQRIVAAADDNVTFHRNLVGDLGQGVQQGSISIADQQQAQERLQAAIVRKTEAEEALVNAQIQLQTLTGLSIGGAAMPQSLRAAVTPTLGEAVAEARQNNPKVKEAQADVDAAHAMVEKANGDLYPTIGVDARGRVGEDIDGFNGKTNDVQARVVFKWNIFDGGINRAKYQEMVRRSSEARFRLHELGRYAEEDVRRAWNSMSTQRKVAQELDTQSKVSDDLLLSYREQFNVGRRSLLDVLDAQNTRYNVQVRLETAKFAEQFAEYQVLAATNKLLPSMNLATPTGATSDARSRFDYGPPPPAELQRRRYPR